MKNRVLSIEHLQKNYHDKNGEIVAIDDVSFDVYDGEFLTIVGPSGCGKSTLLSILSGLDKQSSGKINYHKDNIVLGYMLQSDFLFPWRTILENCLLGLEITKTLDDKKRERVIELLNTYGLGDFINKYPDSLSGGMKQRVALIRTLAIDPDILLLDEAFSALDFQTRSILADDVYKIIKSEGKTAIMVTHNLSEAITMSDRVIVLTRRPSTVKKIYTIKLTGKSTPINNRKCPEFNDYYDMIWRDLDVHL